MSTSPDPDSEPDSDGQLIREDGRSLLRFRRRYRFTTEEVWDTITNPERNGRWMFSTEFEPRTGGASRTDLGELGTVEGSILRWEPPHCLEYRWTEAPYPGQEVAETWQVRYTLRPDAGGTVLVFDHFLPEPRRPEFAAGWHWYLDRLAALLGGNPPPAVMSDDDFDRLLDRYRRRDPAD